MAKLENTTITPWQGDNKFAITKSSVDKQDEFTLEDYLDDPSSGSLNLDTLKNTGMQFLSQTYLKQAQNVINGIIGNTSDGDSSRPKATVGSSSDNIGLDFKKIKQEKYKNVKLTSKLGQYNSLMNLFGVASGLYVGTLGQGNMQAVDDAIGMATQSLPVAGALTNIATMTSKALTDRKKKSTTISTISADTDLMGRLALANYYTILTSKPGLKIKSYGNRLEYVTGDNGNFEIVLDEDLEEYKKNYKFFEEEKDGEKSLFTTGTTLYNDRGVIGLTDKTITSQDTIISSSTRKEVNIEKSSNRLTDYELKENVNDFNEFFKGSYSYFQSKNFPRITKARIFNRINNIYRNIGGLYVEPFMSNNNKLKCFEIPFEFNPTITEGSQSAKYNPTEVLGRILSLKSYVSSDAATVSIEADYLALAEDNGNEEKKFLNLENQWVSGWMSDWTTKKLSMIERQFRSLTLPYIDGSEFVRPPIVRIKMRSTSSNATVQKDIENFEEKEEDGKMPYESGLKVGDLFKYPSLGKNNSRIQITHKYSSATRDKRYVVISVSVTPLAQYGNSYFYGTDGINSLASNSAFFNSVKRNGFRVKIDLAETTKNFLDLIPNYGEYINIEEDEQTNYFLDNMDYLSSIKDEIDLWSCLNAPLKMDLGSIYTKDFPLFLYSTDAGFTQEVKKENYNTISDDSEIADPEKNTSKTFEEYKNDLIREGFTPAEIIKLLINSNGWGIKNKSDSIIKMNNNAFGEWLFKGSYEDFKGDPNCWDSFYSILKESNLSDTEIIKNLKGDWRNDESYKFKLLESEDVDISFDECFNILKETYPSENKKVIDNLKSSKFNMKESSSDEADDINNRNQFENFMAKNSVDFFKNFDEMKECFTDNYDYLLYLISGTNNQREACGSKENNANDTPQYSWERNDELTEYDLYYSWERRNELYKWILESKEGLQAYFKRGNDLGDLIKKIEKYPGIVGEYSSKQYENDGVKRTEIAFSILEKLSAVDKNILTKNDVNKLSKFVDKLSDNNKYNFKFKLESLEEDVKINYEKKEQKISLKIGRGRKFKVKVYIDDIIEGKNTPGENGKEGYPDDICISKFVFQEPLEKVTYKTDVEVYKENKIEYKIENLGNDSLPWVIKKDKLKDVSYVEFTIESEKFTNPSFIIVNGYVDPEHTDYFERNSAIKKITVENLADVVDDNGDINIYNATKGIADNEDNRKKYAAFLFKPIEEEKEGEGSKESRESEGNKKYWENNADCKAFLDEIGEVENYAQYADDKYSTFVNNNYITLDLDDSGAGKNNGEGYDDNKYVPDDSDINTIEMDSKIYDNGDIQMLLFFFKICKDQETIGIKEDGNNIEVKNGEKVTV